MSHVAGKVENVWGPGSYTDAEFIPVPQDAERLLRHFASKTPGFTNDEVLLAKVKYHGSDMPIILGPLKSQVLAAVLHGMIGIVGSEISALKGYDTGLIHINTDQAGLYPATPGVVTIGGRDSKQLAKEGVSISVGADLDHGSYGGSPMRVRIYSIFPTKDPDVWFQLHGSTNPGYVLQVFGLEDKASTLPEAYEAIKAMTMTHSARDMELICMEHGLCGSTCHTPAGWRETRMGKDLARHPLINYSRVAASTHLPPVPFSVQPKDQRPLAGIKVVELARVIATPALSSALAALGAEVIHVQPPHLHDLQPMNLTLTAGKRTTGLDLNSAKDREHLDKLVAQADVVLQAFRIRSLERRGFGLERVLDIANKRGKGIVYLDLSCYGPDGYYAERPGFQQIADAASGCEYVCGQAYGPGGNAPVLPSLPISDMETGAVGVVDVLLALRDRAIHGGSYHASASLVATNTAQLERDVGLYPPEISAKIQAAHKFQPILPQSNAVPEVLDFVTDGWRATTNLLDREDFFQTFDETPFGKNHRVLAPLVKYENKDVTPVWKTGPVPFCWEKYPLFREVKA